MDMTHPPVAMTAPPDPSYLALARSGELAERAARARRGLRACRLCPRRCGADRLAGETGECGIGAVAQVASQGAHRGEERCISGIRGSGTIFFGGCSLRCPFCQNWDISHRPTGAASGDAALAERMLRLQAAGCHNVNLVTPSHVVPQILAALAIAVEAGLRLPLVYNTSGYDAVPTLRLLDGVVDIYMPDFKYWTPADAGRFLTAADYPEAARAAVSEMHRQVGDLVIESGIAVRGLLVRHLVMPDGLEESEAIFRWLSELSAETFVNVMAQYHPAGHVVGDGRAGLASLGRRTSRQEHLSALAFAAAAGLRRAQAA